MKEIAYKNIKILSALFLVFGLVACGGEPTLQEKLYDELSAASDGKWQCYEATEKDGQLFVKIQVDYIVKFKEGKKALAVVKKLAPGTTGMIDFTNDQTGMVVRKVPIE